MKILLLALMTFLGACQLKPTKMVSQESQPKPAIKGAEILQQNPVILDVRPAFDFNLAHTPGAINVRWEDFSQQNPKSRGLPLVDRVSMARRLALVGVDLKTPVVVLGKGSLAQGEEGRVAWTLMLLGVEQVYTLNASLLKDRSVVREAPPVENKPYWFPNDKAFEKVMIALNDFKKVVMDTNVIVLDVRSPEEVRLQSLQQSKKIKASVKALDWKKFFTPQGAANEAILSELQAMGISADSNLIIISNHGVRSGAATYALHRLGWKNVRSFAGGYELYGYK